MIVEASRIPPIHHRRLEIGRRIRNSSLRVVIMGSGIIFLKSRNYNNFLANQKRIIAHVADALRGGSHSCEPQPQVREIAAIEA